MWRAHAKVNTRTCVGAAAVAPRLGHMAAKHLRLPVVEDKSLHAQSTEASARLHGDTTLATWQVPAGVDRHAVGAGGGLA
jgi:hypothetical protein